VYYDLTDDDVDFIAGELCTEVERIFSA